MSSQLKAWGLYRADSSNAVPLKSLDISIKIFHNVARVIYSQEYFNDTDLLIETEFFFPISPEACFDSFEATFNNTTIKGVVKEKEKAKEEYKEAIKQGRTAAYSEINKETGDIMKVQIGNIPQNTSIKVTYSYIQKLETSLNKFWCFRLFSTLTPRYNSMANSLQAFLDHDVTLLSNYPTISKNGSQAYPWSIQAEIHSPSPLTFLKSPSHDIITTYGNENHTCAVTLNSTTKHFPNKDFVLLFSNGRESNVDYLLTPFEDGYCAMVSLIADFEKNSNQQAFEDFAKAKEAENLPSMSTVRGEYIFLIDRSGSMDGERITMARNSLVLFLKSLPKDSLFNVVSFGSDYQFLYDESLAYSQENIDSSTKKIQTFDANMGGTEIYSALLQIFTAPPKKGYPRFVFLLTDGAVSDTQNVLNLIASNSDQSRTFTIGIGNGCSPELISKGAAYGRGKAEFVADTNQIFEKVISLLNASLSPCYSDLSLHADNFDAVVKSVTPNPTSIPFLINGQTVTFFLFLRSAAFEESKKMNLQLQMYDSRKKKSQTVEIALDASEAIENDLIPKLAIHDMIRRLEIQKEKAIGKKDEIILWMAKEDLEKAMTEYSLKFGILCKETAFFCEACDSETSMKNVIPTKVVVPTVLSQDYDSPLLGAPSGGFGGGSRRNRKSSGTNLMSALSSVHPIRSGGGQRMAAPSYDRDARDEDAMLRDLLESLESGTKALKEQQSSMSAELSYQSDICLPEARLEKASATQSGGLFKGLAKGISNAFGSLTSKFSRSSQKEQVSTTSATYESSISVKSDTNSFKDFSYHPSSSTISSQPQNKSSGQYLDIIMKQTVEGFWDPKDSAIRKAILKDGSKLPQIPSQIQIQIQIQIADAAKAEAVWITILIMRWLELACKDDRKAWLLIYQKGYEWLEGLGVDYDAMKDLGTSFINI